VVKWRVWSSAGQDVKEMVKRITDLGFQVGSEWVLPPPPEPRNREKGHAQGQVEAGLGWGHQPRKQRPLGYEQNWREPTSWRGGSIRRPAGSCPSEDSDAPCVWQLPFLMTAGAVSGKG